MQIWLSKWITGSIGAWKYLSLIAIINVKGAHCQKIVTIYLDVKPIALLSCGRLNWDSYMKI